MRRFLSRIFGSKRRQQAVAGLTLLVLVAALVGPTSSTMPAQAASTPSGYTYTGLDAHDGTVIKEGSTYYLYGTRYGCGFQWQNSSSPNCGFGVWSASSLAGPWTFLNLLFAGNGPNSERGGESWQVTCNWGGNGCFNPRMVKRWDNVWLLFFNAPAEGSRGQNNAYYVMGCNSPTGPCGSTAGAPHGSTRKLPLNSCTKVADFSIIVDNSTAYIACSNTTITIEQLDYWWTTGIGNQQTGAGAVRDISYLTNVEAPGVFKTSGGQWVLTYSNPNCGYCAGVGTFYSFSTNGVLGSWLPPANPGYGQPVNGRGGISATSCGGQPRTVFQVDGQAYQWIDNWYGGPSQTNAAIRIEPLIQTGPLTKTADGTPWAGGFAPFQCE